MLDEVFMDECFREMITNKMNKKIEYINKCLLKIASSKGFGLDGASYIRGIVDSIDTNKCEGFAIHNVYLIETIISRVLEGHGFMREIVIYDLEGELLDLPYSVVIGQHFLDTIQLLLLDLELPKLLNKDFLERHIRKGVLNGS